MDGWMDGSRKRQLEFHYEWITANKDLFSFTTVETVFIIATLLSACCDLCILDNLMRSKLVLIVGRNQKANDLSSILCITANLKKKWQELKPVWKFTSFEPIVRASGISFFLFMDRCSFYVFVLSSLLLQLLSSSSLHPLPPSCCLHLPSLFICLWWFLKASQQKDSLRLLSTLTSLPPIRRLVLQ